MTENKLLNEFLDINKKPLDYKGYLYDYDLAYESVEIADKFAIGFVKFINETDSFHHAEDDFHFNGSYYNYEEFLEIYKKQKYGN